MQSGSLVVHFCYYPVGADEYGTNALCNAELFKFPFKFHSNTYYTEARQSHRRLIRHALKCIVYCRRQQHKFLTGRELELTFPFRAGIIIQSCPGLKMRTVLYVLV